MKLIKATVEKYKCVENSGEWQVNQVTCLVGKNEAGKSALLEALHKLKPDDDSQANFVAEDYPRRFALTPEGKKDLANANVLTTVWTLNEEECAKLNNEFPGLSLTSEDEIIIEKGYSNSRYWSFSIDEKKLVGALIDNANLNASELAQLKNCETIEDIGKKLDEIENKTEKQTSLHGVILAKYPEYNARKGIAQKIYDFLPTFLYFKEYYKLPGRVAIDDLLARRSEPGRYTFEYKVFDALLNLVGSSADEIAASGRSEELIMKLEAISNRLTGTIFTYWSQNRHLSVRFSFDHALPQEPAPFNTGWIFSTRIWNERHKASVPFEQRSTGFIWFFSFLVWFSDVREIYGDNIMILLDEPGLTLHGKAQKDLLRYINEELRPNYQVIYTTHSPFMIDSENIFDVRTVQDVVKRTIKGEELYEEVLGTKVSDRILSRDPDTLLPLQGVAGFDIAQTMFLGPYVLVVEGPSEYAYIQWFSRALSASGREGLDLRWAIAPAEGATKVSSFVTLFNGRGLKIAVLLDYHEGQKGLVDNLEKSKLLEPDHLLRTTDFTDKGEADIEDLIGWNLYRYLVNKSMNLHPQVEISDDVATVGEQRIVKFVDDKFRTMPPGIEEFDHYRPAAYLLGTSKNEEKNLPGLGDALDRFEALFKKLNGLLPNH